jgi:predicted RNase H-related nuclease YkuK (DUF458 family)
MELLLSSGMINEKTKGRAMWKRGSGLTISKEEMISFLETTLCKEHQIVIGTDSQPYHKGAFMVTAIAVLCDDPNLHGRYFYLQHKESAPHHNLYERIYAEVMATLNIADEIRHGLSEGARLSIHLDVSPEGYGSTGRYSQGLVSMVRGYGYENVQIKPFSWCASKIADKYTKRAPLWFIRSLNL